MQGPYSKIHDPTKERPKMTDHHSTEPGMRLTEPASETAPRPTRARHRSQYPIAAVAGRSGDG